MDTQQRWSLLELVTAEYLVINALPSNYNCHQYRQKPINLSHYC